MTVHDFKPTRYYNTIGSHEPALRIADGDTVRTTTIDAWGQDEHETKVIDGPNPMTGPFYVEGAEPGDTLVVVLDSLVPNRPRGYVRAGLAENVVDPDYVNHLPSRDVSEWHVDLEGGMVTLVKPETNLGRFSVPLAPMVGCFGVAPDTDRQYRRQPRQNMAAIWTIGDSPTIQPCIFRCLCQAHCCI